MADHPDNVRLPWLPQRRDSRRAVQEGIAEIVLHQTGSAAIAQAVGVGVPFNGHAIMDMGIDMLASFLYINGLDYFVAWSVAFEVTARRRVTRFAEDCRWEAYTIEVRDAHNLHTDFESDHILRELCARLDDMAHEQE